MFCALSGEAIVDAVVSPRSGSVFERKLIESYIATAGKDPINDEPLSTSDLIPLSLTSPIVPPKPPTYSSIPTMLSAFQNEWDALALETYTLRKQLHDVRKELSGALYRYEAAVRVAARVTKERDDAQTALTKLTEALASGNVDIAPTSQDATENSSQTDKNSSQTSQNGSKPEISTGSEGIPSDIQMADAQNGDSSSISAETVSNSDPVEIPVSRLLLARETLFNLHKKLKFSSLITKDSVATISITSTDKYELKGLLDVKVDPVSKKMVCSGAFGVKLLPSDILCPDSVVCAFLTEDGSSTAVSMWEGHLKLLEQNVTSKFPVSDIKLLATHPSEALFVVATNSNQWALTTVDKLIYASDKLDPITALAIHVDGILLAIARNEAVDIYDITSTQKVSTIDVGKGTITKIDFALNGFWILTASENKNNECSIDIYDLRKSNRVHAITLPAPADFVLDPSSLMLVTHEQALKKLKVHLYAKKGKVWVENPTELDAQDIKMLGVASTPEEVKKLNTVEIVGFGESQTVGYLIAVAGSN